MVPSKVDHKPTGRICTRCGLSARHHRDRREYARQYAAANPRDTRVQDRIIGIDGEGIGRRPHRYIYLAAADESGRTWSVENADRLTTEQFLDFILGLPARALIVGFAFTYDLTKGLTDLPDEALYLLFREELRARFVEGKIIYRPITWRGYRINYMNRRFSVQKGARRATVWDIFRFFQSKFTSALIDWKIAEVKELEWMAAMKERRAEFDKLAKTEGVKAIYEYCKKECLYLAKLCRGLITAHEDAGITLTSYYGAGSTASALLKKWDVRSYRGETPEAMREPLACAFFGGRFENSVAGSVTDPVWDYDISSAYPYQAALLPCLCHGHWEHVGERGILRRLRTSRLALLHWRIRKPAGFAWGPFPVRSTKGTIAFPRSCAGGWTWKDEYLAALKLNPDIEILEGWVYDTDCDCRPFGGLPGVYLERLKLGKDNLRGIPLKLGPNSVYGKVAQSKGLNPPFQSWVWAGCITSGTRAQLLDAIARARDPWAILMLATDGVWTREELELAAPVETGTGETGKPLGGWEKTPFPDGVFCVRPGIYFPLHLLKLTGDALEKELKKVRARGLGKRVLYEQAAQVMEAWEAGGAKLEIKSVQRFVGAKTGISAARNRSADYGEWVNHDISVGFSPLPKRERLFGDNRLKTWDHFDYESVPYKEALKSPEAKLLELAQLIAEEQPDAEFGQVD